MTTTAFDPVKFKNTTRQQWDAAAEAWNRWSPLLSRWLGPATELMLDMTGVKDYRSIRYQPAALDLPIADSCRPLRGVSSPRVDDLLITEQVHTALSFQRLLPSV